MSPEILNWDIKYVIDIFMMKLEFYHKRMNWFGERMKRFKGIRLRNLLIDDKGILVISMV